MGERSKFMAMRLGDEGMLARLLERNAAAGLKLQRMIKENGGQVPEIPDPQSNLPPNAFRELMPQSQTFGEGDA